MNIVRILAVPSGVLVAVFALIGAEGNGFCVAQTPKDLNPLSAEVMALQALNQLQLTPVQLTALAKLASDTAPKPRVRKPAQASAKFRQKLTDLHEALVKGEAEDIQILTGEVARLQSEEKPKLDDAVEISDNARKKAPEVVKMLTARQVAIYLVNYEAYLGDPAEVTFVALEHTLKIPAAEWNAARDSIAEEVAVLVVGLDPAHWRKVAEKVAVVLDKGHKMKEDELKKARPELEKSLRSIVDAAGPLEIMRHFLERNLANLLSNPRLPTAIELVQKNQKK